MTDARAEMQSPALERQVAHPPEKVWRALTQAPLIEDWLMANDFQPTVGHRFTFRTQPTQDWNGVTDCEVLEVEAPRRLSYSWNASGEEAATGLRTVVTWTLTPKDGGTHLRLEQSGFRPQDLRNLQDAQHGWRRFLAGLDRVAGGF
jgi:uncharacterized protein YndB with AHSA1/START domain